MISEGYAAANWIQRQFCLFRFTVKISVMLHQDSCTFGHQENHPYRGIASRYSKPCRSSQDQLQACAQVYHPA